LCEEHNERGAGARRQKQACGEPGRWIPAVEFIVREVFAERKREAVSRPAVLLVVPPDAGTAVRLTIRHQFRVLDFDWWELDSGETVTE
jgi:hypothetical protein